MYCEQLQNCYGALICKFRHYIHYSSNSNHIESVSLIFSVQSTNFSLPKIMPSPSAVITPEKLLTPIVIMIAFPFIHKLNGNLYTFFKFFKFAHFCMSYLRLFPVRHSHHKTFNKKNQTLFIMKHCDAFQFSYPRINGFLFRVFIASASQRKHHSKTL